MRIQDNFVVGHGNLYRRSDNKLIRKNYEKHHKAITGVDDLKATLRAGQWAWPGGYPLFFITSDGAALSFESVRENFYQCCYSSRHGLNDGWRIVCCDINYEEVDLVCDHSGKPIQCAYSE